MPDTQQLTIARLGAQGDGIADTPAGVVYVPFTLPGETVRAEVDGERGRLVEVLTASADRTPPICRHFARCGGCTRLESRPTASRLYPTRTGH
jgi:23S rRNA (uracil1939-C5)-methyltransferase